MALGSLFLVFAVAATALAAFFTRSVLAAAGATLVFLLVLAFAGNLRDLGTWLPVHLAGALDPLVRGATDAGDYVRALVDTPALTAVAQVGAVGLAARREL